MSLKVGIDISSITYQRGVSRYTSNLVSSLLDDSRVRLSAYGSSLRQHQFLIDFTNQHPRLKQTQIDYWPPSILAKLWQLGWPKVSNKLPGIQLFHSWDWIQPPDKNIPLVSTIHDLAMLEYPETAHPEILQAHQRSWQVLKERRAHIIAVSQATKQDIVERLQISPSKIHVVYEALPLETKRVSDQLSEIQSQKIIHNLNLTQPYILFVGTREPRKNLLRLIEAWQPLSKDYQLLIAGEAGWDDTSSEKTISKTKKLLSNPNLRFLGRVSDQELAVLYGEAELFAYPSLYEGFGLPILEAFYHGTPVLTSNISSMPEVAGEAAVLVNPLEVDSITKGIEKILKESKEDQRKRLQKMLVRLHLFDWQRTADQTIKVYQQAISEF